MIISHKHNYLFVEVPHTACTAVSRELELNYGGGQVLYKHANYSEFRSIASSAERKYFVFAGIRNPLDAIVTEYAKYKSNHGGEYTNPQKHLVNGGWVADSHLEKFRFVQATNADFPTYLNRYHTAVYHQWVTVEHRRYDFILRFESLQQDFSDLLNRLGLQQVRPLPVVNSSTRSRDWSAYYPEKLHAHAASVFGPFMKKWGYELPSEWAKGEIPLSSRLEFAISEAMVNGVARFVALSPYSEVVQRFKRLARRIGAA